MRQGTPTKAMEDAQSLKDQISQNPGESQSTNAKAKKILTANLKGPKGELRSSYQVRSQGKLR